jgi:hypothetical protein
MKYTKEAVCVNCKKTFKSDKYKETKTCSKACRIQYYIGDRGANFRGGKTTLLCKICNKPFQITPANAHKRVTCSKKCHNKWRSKFLVGEKSARWNGGRVVGTRGYVFVHVPNHPFANRDGYVFEHRYAVEQSLGRLLKKTEVVHHINGKTTDNRIENLQLFPSQKEHLSFHASQRN